MTDPQGLDLTPFLERVKTGTPIDELKPELFSKLCLKEHYLDECEPGYCVFRITESCPYVHALRRLKDSLS